MNKRDPIIPLPPPIFKRATFVESVIRFVNFFSCFLHDGRSSVTEMFFNLITWSAPNIWVSVIAQLVEHCSANAEAMSLKPVEALKYLFELKFAIA